MDVPTGPPSPPRLCPCLYVYVCVRTCAFILTVCVRRRGRAQSELAGAAHRLAARVGRATR